MQFIGCTEVQSFMEIKKGESHDSKLGDPVDIENPKTLKSAAGLWPDWLPYGHAAFLLILLLALLLGYGLPYEKPEQPQRDYRANYESVEEEKKAVKEYDEKVEAYEKEKKAWDEGGEESRRGWIAVGRNLAKFSTVLWLIFSFIVYGFMPLLRLIRSILVKIFPLPCCLYSCWEFYIPCLDWW